MGGDVLLASRWEPAVDLLRLLVSGLRVAFGHLPDWARYPLLVLIAAGAAWIGVTTCRDKLRERRERRDRGEERKPPETVRGEVKSSLDT
ncbi:hypothetical protein ABZ990_27265 [Streptomyces sp. NPDC046203]|uniref:hypothetical protein n=1 Tax=Streptomyces sp. NPDC046203 TaxID=3154602 RepID=UPI0033E8ADE8